MVCKRNLARRNSASQKLVNRGAHEFMCITCLGKHFDVSEERLRENTAFQGQRLYTFLYLISEGGHMAEEKKVLFSKSFRGYSRKDVNAYIEENKRFPRRKSV